MRSRACLWYSVEVRHLIDSAPYAHVVRTLQKYASNRESMDMLQKHIESMNTMIKSVRPKDGPCPPKLEEQLGIFSKYVGTFRGSPVASIALTCPCEYRNVERVAVAVGKLKGDKEDPTTQKIAQKISQALRKDKVAEALELRYGAVARLEEDTAQGDVRDKTWICQCICGTRREC